MPFPWKKAKNSRISQLVKDHVQNSKKRRGGSSLTVESGFRTSLVDFAIKNGERPSKKNRAKAPKNPSGNENNDPVILQSSSILPFNSSSCCSSPSESRNFDEVSLGANESGVVVVAVVKIILVVVLALALALGTKKLAVGITISAFVLIFLEYVGKAMLKPCSEAEALQGLILNVEQRGVFGLKEDNADEKNDPGLENCESRRSFQECGVIEAEREKEICKDEEIELKRRMSRKDKIKSKMKKLFPKKLRSSKEEESSKIYSCTCEEDESEDGTEIN